MTAVDYSRYQDGADRAMVPAAEDRPQVPLQPVPASAVGARDFRIAADGKNRLLEVAMPLLGASVRLRGLHSHDGIEALHARLTGEIQTFERTVEAEGYDAATVVAARYCICAMVDEAILSRHWGADSLWPERPLLSIFHNETWGGEKFFAILDRVLAENHRYVDLLELLYYCMTLGFEGKFHVIHNGQSKLDHLIESVHRQLERHRGAAPARLTEPEPQIVERKQRISWRLPLWAIPLIGLGLLTALHLAFDISLDRRIEGARQGISTLLSGEMAGRN